MAIDQSIIQRLTRNEADMSFKRRVQTVFEWLPPDESGVYLDCACGRGFYLRYYKEVSGAKLVGLELEADVVRKAAANLSGFSSVVLTRGNIYALPFPDNYFDGIILSEILEHIEDDVRGLREVFRVLKPGGAVAITVPNANYPFWWDPINKTLETLFGTKIRRGILAGIWANHVRLYDFPSLRKAVTAAGFDIEAERAFTHYCFPFIHNIAYGIGKPLLEGGFLPGGLSKAADRTTFDQNSGSLLNPINLGLAIFNFFDRKNVMDEPPGRTTVNICLKGRKPG